MDSAEPREKEQIAPTWGSHTGVGRRGEAVPGGCPAVDLGPARPKPGSSVRIWEHSFVTSQGSSYGRLRRALDTGNATIALAAAADLEHVGLEDALELLLVILDSEPARFDRAAIRWHGRYCREVKDVDLLEAQAVLACLAALRGSRPASAAHALADLVHRKSLGRAGEALNRWGHSAGMQAERK